MTTYANPFYSAKHQDSKPEYTVTSEPVLYGGYLIYRRSKDVFDVVKDGVIVSMCAGINGAKRFIEKQHS